MVATGRERAKQVLAKELAAPCHGPDSVGDYQVLRVVATNAHDYHGIIVNGCFGNFWDTRQ